MESTILLIAGAADVKSMLAAAGLLCDLAASGEEALERLRSTSYQAVFVEIESLNDADCGLIDEMHRLRPGLCVLATASSPSAEEVLQALRRGVFDCVLRPFSPQSLLACLKRGLETRKLFAEISHLSRGMQERTQHLEARSTRLQKDTQEMLAVNDVAQAMTSCLDLEEILRIILDGIHRVINFDRVVLSLINKDRMVEEAKLCTGSNDPRFLRQSWQIGDPSNPWMEQVLDLKRTIVVDPVSDPDYAGSAVAALYSSPFVKVPMVVKGSVIGTITADNGVTRRPFADEDMRRLELFCGHAGIAIENARLYYDILKSREEVVHAQKQLVEAERLAALGAMAASINHEINNPLCAILLDTQLLLMSVPPEQEKLRKRVESIEASVKRIRDVTDKVSAVKRTITTDYQPRTKMLDLNLSTK